MTIRLEELVYLDRTASFNALMDFLGFSENGEIRRYFDQHVTPQASNVGRWRGQLDPGDHEDFNAPYREILDDLRADGVEAMPVDPDILDEIALPRDVGLAAKDRTQTSWPSRRQE